MTRQTDVDGDVQIRQEELDKDSNGAVTAREMSTVMQFTGPNPAEARLQDMISEVDADGNGILDFPEFMSEMGRKMNDTDIAEELVEAVKVFDRTTAELCDATTTLGVSEIVRLNVFQVMSV